ncbi:c-type cytochrome [Neorhodopirellula lusitana]|uniref:c-type cytochrome n=1 Tax=Neorhodopirellula lusitana TaxID=445327 RepID=UPI00384AC79C
MRTIFLLKQTNRDAFAMKRVCDFDQYRMGAFAMKTIHILLGLLLFGLAGCTPDPKSGKGFTLPEGDITRGKDAFEQLNCQACHTVVGVSFNDPEKSPDSETSDQKIVVLGGSKSRVQTYGDLVTSIINPSHRFARGYDQADIAMEGESKMRNYNDVMTVQQLIDLVAFLESHYSVKPYEPTRYSPYLF